MSLKICLSTASLLLLLSASNFLQPTFAVINGKKALPNEFPYVVDIRNGTDNSPFCGGTLVTRRHIVTAVYCVSTIEHLIIDGPPTLLQAKDVRVFVGSVGARKGKTYEVEKLFVHPDYNVKVTISWNNIAVIKLKTEVDVKIASLPSKNVAVGETVTVAGWGYTDANKKNPAAELRKYTLKVVETGQCKKKWESALGDSGSVISSHIKSNKVFCAVPEVKGTGVGFGDMGTSAVIHGQYVGFPMFSQDEDKTIPEVFASVVGYKDFIQSVIKSH